MIRRSRFNPGLIGLALALVSCSDTSTVAPNVLNLARPNDIAFTCYGGLRVNGGTTSTAAAPEATPTAQPTTSCDYRAAEHYIIANDGEDINTAILRLEPRPPGQQDVGTAVVGTATYYGFILQSASGTVALAGFPSKPSSEFAGGNSDVFVVDADPLTPGKNAISVGEDPIGIETDKSGCYEVVANAGSCDLSTLDVNSVLSNLSGAQAIKPIIKRLPIVDGGGQPIYARPAAIVGEEADVVIGNACPAQPSGIAYAAFPACHMVAALDMSQGDDQAHIVAAIKFSATGVATQVTDLTNLACPVECGDTPTAQGVADATPRPSTLAYRFDPNAYDLTTSTANPQRRLAIGAGNSPVITVVDLADSYPAAIDPANPYVAQPKPLPMAITQVTLENEAPGKPLGVSQIALSPQVGLGGTMGTALASDSTGPAGAGQYVYAITSDHTVRVADVLGYTNNHANPALGVTECETQADTRFLQPGVLGNNYAQLQCIPVADKPIRRNGAIGPGIQLPSKGIPTSVAFVRTPQLIGVDGTVQQQDTAPGTLVGTFAIVASAAGPTYVVNVSDVNKAPQTTFDPNNPQATSPTLLMAHQLRHNLSNPGEGDASITFDTNGVETGSVPSCLLNGTANRGGPRTTAAPTQTGITGTPGTASTAATKATELPTFRQVRCDAAFDAPNGVAVSEMQLAAPADVRQRVYPDLGGMFDVQTWTMTWEGPIAIDTGTAIDGPSTRVGQWVTNSTESASINDQTRPFCSLGVEVGDVVEMHGCDPSLNSIDCPQDSQCYVAADTQFTFSGVHLGSCLKSSEIDRLAPACRDYLVSSRRFTVRYSSAGQLEIAPRLHELRTTPLDGCTDDNQCQMLADYSVQNGLDQFSASNTDPHTWACVDDATRKPFLNGSTKRCVQTCNYHADAQDADCDVGSICVGAKPADPVNNIPATPGVCKEGVIPPQECVDAPQKLDLRAGDAFALVNDKSGYLSPLISDASDPNGKCILDPKYNDPKVPRLQISRVSLDAPACDPLADPVSGQKADGTFEPNPCSLTTDSWSNELTYTAGTCASSTTTLVDRTMVPAIKLRTPYATLTMIDPFYPGDAQCPLDRGGASQIQSGERVPLVISGYQLGFTITGGLTPVQLQLYASAYNPVIPVRVVAGPTGSIWVMDDGDFLSTTLGLASTEGAVFRVESRALSTINELQ